MIAWLQAKLAVWGTVALAVLGALAYAFTKGRSSGKASATQQITHDLDKQAREVQNELRKVDNQPIDFGSASQRLRDRANHK